MTEDKLPDLPDGLRWKTKGNEILLQARRGLVWITVGRHEIINELPDAKEWAGLNAIWRAYTNECGD